MHAPVAPGVKTNNRAKADAPAPGLFGARIGYSRLALEPGPPPTPELEAFARWLFAETGGQPLFVIETLKDIYYAEKQILKTLPKMAKAAQSQDLKAGFEQHMQETESHVERLERVFEMMGKTARGRTCEAILGIIDEGKTIMDDFKGSQAIDAGLISAAQAVEHYEIARYGTLKTWAQQMGKNDAAALLDATLKEEFAADQRLTRVAQSYANREAA